MAVSITEVPNKALRAPPMVQTGYMFRVHPTAPGPSPAFAAGMAPAMHPPSGASGSTSRTAPSGSASAIDPTAPVT